MALPISVVFLCNNFFGFEVFSLSAMGKKKNIKKEEGKLDLRIFFCSGDIGEKRKREKEKKKKGVLRTRIPAAPARGILIDHGNV